MKNEVAVSLFVVVLLGGLGVGYIAGTTDQQPASTSVSITARSFTTTSVSTMVSSTPTLIFLANVRPAVVPSGQNVSLSYELYNPLNVNLTIVVTPWRVGGSGCSDSFPMGYNIYQGHYDYGNVSGAKPLALYDMSQVVLCPAGYNSTYDFGANSDVASVTFLQSTYSRPINYTDVLSGYWVPTNVGGQTSYVQQNFSPGTYTILFFDRWGQQLIDYFDVT